MANIPLVEKLVGAPVMVQGFAPVVDVQSVLLELPLPVRDPTTQPPIAVPDQVALAYPWIVQHPVFFFIFRAEHDGCSASASYQTSSSASAASSSFSFSLSPAA